MVERPTATGPSCWCRRGGAHGVWADVRLGRGHLARPGTILCGRGPSTPSGTGFLSPNARTVPGWCGPHPAAWNVPHRTAGGAGCHHLWTVRGLRAREPRRPPRLNRGRPTASSDTGGFTGERTAQGSWQLDVNGRSGTGRLNQCGDAQPGVSGTRAARLGREASSASGEKVARPLWKRAICTSPSRPPVGKRSRSCTASPAP